MSDTDPDVVVLTTPIALDQLRAIVARFFIDMVKLVVDVKRNVIAIGGELHADAEAVLLEQGSQQQDLWGANYYPGRGPVNCIEYTALINIRPSQENRSMEIEAESIRQRIRELVFSLVGQGEPL